MMAGNNSNWRANQYRKNPPITKAKRKQPQPISREHLKPIKVSNSRENIEGIEQILYQHKLVISFDGRVTNSQVTEWITAYNKEHSSHALSLFESLIHSLFVVLVESDLPEST
jgi:hypothetical protein